MIATPEPPNVFLLHVQPLEGLSLAEVAESVIAAARDFAPAGRASMPPLMLSHRVLARDGGGLVWEIAYDGIDVAEEEGAVGTMLDAITGEARARLDGVAAIAAAEAFVDLLRPEPDRGFSQAGARALVAEPGWESYAQGSGEPESGTPLPPELRERIEGTRKGVRAEPDLRPTRGGHVYTGASDKAHRAYLTAYLNGRADRASPVDKRKILAFLAFQTREGTTSAINTWDNQIVTWGTGWSGLGWLGIVLGRAVANEGLRDALGAAGLRYRGKNTYDVVDLGEGAVLTGQKPALQVIKGSVDLLNVLIDVARDEATRDAATEAQLVTFMGGSANVTSADTMFTQSLFNYVAHLRHWLSGYAAGCLEWAAPQVSGPPCEERDRKLAVLVTRYFYGKARLAKASPPAWRQILQYVDHMKIDGLDCKSEPFFQAASAPADDPFEAVPLPVAATKTTKPAAAQPAKTTPQPAPAQPAKTTPQPAPAQPAKTTPQPAPAQPAKTTPPPAPTSTALQNAPLAGQPVLEAVAAGKAMLQRGVRGEAVKALQQAFIALGIEVPGGDDGDFGGGLQRAVKAFQSARGIEADGVVGKMTLAAVDAALGERGERSAQA